MKQDEATLSPPALCPVCQVAPLEHPPIGRRRTTCSESCRKRRDRQRVAARLRLLDEVMAAYRKAQWPGDRRPLA